MTQMALPLLVPAVRPAPGARRCAHCGGIFPPEEFGRSGRKAACRACRRTEHADRWRRLTAEAREGRELRRALASLIKTAVPVP